MPASTRRRSSDLLFRWCPLEMGFDYQGNPYALSSNKVITGTSDRGGTVGSASSVDVNGRNFVPGYKSPRWYHSYDSTTGLFLPRGVLLEGSRTNLCLRSQEFTNASWTKIATAAATDGSTDPAGGVTADSCNAPAIGDAFYQTVTFTADATKVVSLYLKAGTSTASEFGIFDDTAGTWRHRARATWSAGVPTLSTITGTGTLFAVESLVGGWYRCAISAAGVVAANTNRVFLYPAIPASGTGTVIAWGAQVENAAFPSSYIPTTTAAVTRSVDALSFAFNAVPQATTFYLKWREGGNLAANAGGYFFQIGTGATSTIAMNTATRIQPFFYDASGNLNYGSGAVAVPVAGDIVEVRLTLNADGTLSAEQSVNGAASVALTWTANVARTMPTAWSNTTLVVMGAAGGGSVPYAACEKFHIAPGTKTLAQMRAA